MISLMSRILKKNNVEVESRIVVTHVWGERWDGRGSSWHKNYCLIKEMNFGVLQESEVNIVNKTHYISQNG